jgi:hypothetical protein
MPPRTVALPLLKAGHGAGTVEDEMKNNTTEQAAPTKKPLQLSRETIRSLNVKTRLRTGMHPETPDCPSSHDSNGCQFQP